MSCADIRDAFIFPEKMYPPAPLSPSTETRTARARDSRRERGLANCRKNVIQEKGSKIQKDASKGRGFGGGRGGSAGVEKKSLAFEEWLEIQLHRVTIRQ
jgi:hypothetical protein